jgi:hypothetical protein
MVKAAHPPTVEQQPFACGRKIRQPYRITMAEWDFNVYQKRILTGVIEGLQEDIARVEKGFPPEDLERFRATGQWVDVGIAFKGLVRNGRNHYMLHEALEELALGRSSIVLPEVKGRKGPSIPRSVHRLQIQNLGTRPYGRILMLRLHRDFALELVRTSCGLTSLSLDVMHTLRSVHAVRMYEILSHWRDLERLHMPVAQLRRWMQVGERFKGNKELIRKVVRPAERQLARCADTFGTVEPVYSANRITHFSIQILHHRRQAEQAEHIMRLREQATNILRIRFRFREEHFRQISGILSQDALVKPLNEKLGMLWQWHDDHPHEVRDVPGWVLASLFNAFPGRRGG